VLTDIDEIELIRIDRAARCRARCQRLHGSAKAILRPVTNDPAGARYSRSRWPAGSKQQARRIIARSTELEAVDRQRWPVCRPSGRQHQSHVQQNVVLNLYYQFVSGCPMMKPRPG
jgi:hypothetical protein